ncbi:MAG TPA: hypothetical protein PLB01_00365 [Thermoanaerobaculia bacterium]|nr:hypothetical protein [Thermoanaerobaculia bacterium]
MRRILGSLKLVAVAAAIALLLAPAFAGAAPLSPILASPTIHAQIFGGAVPEGVLAVVVKALAIGVLIWKGIDGLKDLFPDWTAAHPGALRIFNAVAALLASLGVCWATGMAHTWVEVGWCSIQGVLAFITAAGLHEGKSASDKARAGR